MLPPSLVLSSGDPTLDRRLRWALASAAAGDHVAAAELCTELVALVPGFVAAWHALALAREARGDRSGAVAALRRCLVLDPADVLGAGARLAALGEPGALSPAHVAALFDAYAPRFDDHLSQLGYNGPDLLREAIDAVAPGRFFPRALDLGCGTGLVGLALRDRCRHLAGCDLSPAMLDLARQRGLYDALTPAEAKAVLDTSPEGTLDLVLAADVLVYVADLAGLLAAAARALAPGGLIAVTAEGADPEASGLGPEQRHRHGRAVLARAAKAAGLDVVLQRDASCRRERGEPVPGHVAVLARPG